MKDAYSFDRDWQGLDVSYQLMKEAYTSIFSRCGLTFRPVEADTGAMGGRDSEEFVALCEYGENDIVFCESCDMAATTERAEGVDAPADAEEALPLEEVHTPGTKTIEAVANYLEIPESKTMKALLFTVFHEDLTVKEYVCVFIRGDRSLNRIKLINALGVADHQLEFADEEKIGAVTGSVAGFTGPMGLHDCRILVDSELPGLRNLCAGACKTDNHIKNVNYGRDYKADLVTDLKLVEGGAPCPQCGAILGQARGIEVGQIFKLGTKYSDSMGAVYKDENMAENPIVMGCYGIGVTRTMAAVVEQNHDADGIIWPMSIAPYHVIITLVKPDDAAQKALAEDLYRRLTSEGVETLLDDRDERPGVKFKDADIWGIPLRITVGKRAGEGVVEYKPRNVKEREELSAFDAASKALERVRREVSGIKGI
jgi:prolyl-tRNA synthetase